MKIVGIAVFGILAGAISSGACGGDDTSPGGASGSAGASGAGVTGSGGDTGTGGGAGGTTGGTSVTGGSSGAAGAATSNEAGASQEGGSTDITTSTECNAYCDKAMSMCMADCDRTFACRIRAGDCAASTRAFLKCTVDTGQWACAAGGFSVLSSCKRDATLCQ